MGAKICKPCKKRKNNTFQGGSILDRVISQASNQDQCLLYKLANYKKGKRSYTFLCMNSVIQGAN